MKAHIFYFLLGFICLLSTGLSVATYQRNQLVWDRVMADGTPNMVAGWNAQGDPAEIAQASGVSGLTATRVPVASSATSLTDDADLTWTAASNTLTAGRVVTVPTGNVAGLNVGTISGDPAAPVNGDVWLNTSTQSLKGRVNGTSVPLNTIKYSASVGAFDFPNTAAGAQSSLAIAGITGAVVGDPAIIGYPTVPPTNGVYYAYISAANTVTVVFTNTSTAAIDPANQNFNIIVFNR